MKKNSLWIFKPNRTVLKKIKQQNNTTYSFTITTGFYLDVDAVLADGAVVGDRLLRTGANEAACLGLSACAAVEAGVARALVDGALAAGARVAALALAEVAGDVGLDAGGAVEAGRGVADVDGDLAVHALVAGQARALEAVRVDLGAEAAVLAGVGGALVDAQLAVDAGAAGRAYAAVAEGFDRHALACKCLE